MVAPEVMLGKWKLVKSENFDSYMKEIGVGMILRNMANLATPTVEIVKVDDATWNLITAATFKTTELKFKLDGTEFEEVTGDGRKCLTTMKWDENGVLIQNQVGQGSCKGSELTRTFKDDEMILELKCGDVVSTRVYKKQEA